VHSVVSWDFAMALLPGWHETIFPPYFVAGAIHSGLAMVLTLLIPLRRLLRLERIITVEHFDAVARTILVTTCIIGYAYVIEGLMPRYSGNRFEEQFAHWRETGSMAWAYWALFLLNVFFPLSFAFRRLRRNLNWLFIVSILMNVGMWLERYHIIATATWHDFLPHNWGPYAPTWVEGTITAGAFAFFLFWFFNFARLLPTVAASEVKEILAEQQTHGVQVGLPADKHGKIAMSKEGILAVFHEPDEMMEALRALRRAAFRRLELFSPVKVGEVDKVLGLPHGPVRFWTLSGALLGMAGGFALALGSAGVNNLVVGGKPPMAYIPYCIVGFEGTILLGTLANLTGLIVHARLGRTKLPPAYDPRFSRDKFGLLVECPAERLDEVRDIIRPMEPEEVHVIG
jgi:hypothetical protein